MISRWNKILEFHGIHGSTNKRTHMGIFGIPATKKSEIERLVKQIESLNPTPCPTLELEKVTPILLHWHYPVK